MRLKLLGFIEKILAYFENSKKKNKECFGILRKSKRPVHLEIVLSISDTIPSYSYSYKFFRSNMNLFKKNGFSRGFYKRSGEEFPIFYRIYFKIREFQDELMDRNKKKSF